MLNIIIFGPPGAGKGTHSSKLSIRYELVHLSTGDIFRANIKGGTDLGRQAKSYMDKGKLVPDEVTIKILESEVDKNFNSKGFIFDGFPRTIAQAEALDKFLAGKKLCIAMTLSLEVDDEELIKRLLLRGKSSGRSDDADENVIRNRILEYNKKTSPLIKYYQKQNKLSPVKGNGCIEDIFERLCGLVDKS